MRWIASVVLAALLSGAGPAGAQGALPAHNGAEEGTRYFDYFMSRLRTDNGTGPGAVGGRMMWSLAPLAEPGWASALERIALGGYLARVPAESVADATGWRYGLQTDLSLAQSPFQGRVDPLVSLAVGAVRVRSPGIMAPSEQDLPRLLARPALLPARTTTDLSLAPGVGARVQLLPGVALRGDARQVLEFADQGVRRQLEFSGALSVQAG